MRKNAVIPPIPEGVANTDTVATIPATVATTATTIEAGTIPAIDPLLQDSSDKSADLSIYDSIDNSIKSLIDNLIGDTTITPIQTPHEIAIEKLSESEALLNDAILQFEAAKLSVHNATTATQPVVNMDEIDLESEAIRVAAIEAKLSLNCRTAELVLIARRQRLQNAIHAVKNAVESVNEEVSKILVNRMIECEKQLTQNLLGLNEFRQVASALGWRSGTLAEACEIIQRDYNPILPDIDLPRRVALPDCLAKADVALNPLTPPKPMDGQMMADPGLYNRGDAGRRFDGDVQDAMVAGRERMRVDSLLQYMVNRHDGRKFSTAPARRMDMRLGGFVNIELPTGGSVRAY